MSSAARSYSAECVTCAAPPGPTTGRLGRRSPGLAFVPPHEEVLGLVGRALDEDAHPLAAHRAQLRDLALNAKQLVPAGVDLLLRNALREKSRDGPLFAREVENADVVHLCLAHEVADLLEGLVGLARVADDEVVRKVPPGTRARNLSTRSRTWRSP